MNNLIDQIGDSGGIAWAVFAAAVAYVLRTTVRAYLDFRTFRLQHQAEVDLDLRSRRLDSYRELWTLTKTFPKWPRRASTYEDSRKLAIRLRRWYFEGGGIYLSTESRRQYERVQQRLVTHSGALTHGPLPDAAYDCLRRECSLLRTELTRDVQSRHRLT